jgi:hypothetical protein
LLNYLIVNISIREEKKESRQVYYSEMRSLADNMAFIFCLPGDLFR